MAKKIYLFTFSKFYKIGSHRCKRLLLIQVMTRDRYLVKHLEAHEGSRPYRCDYDGCKKGFETQELLNAHWEHVHIGDVSVYKCPKCEKGSSTC